MLAPSTIIEANAMIGKRAFQQPLARSKAVDLNRAL